MKFLIAHRRTFRVLALAFLLALILPLTACGAPAWLSDASSIIAMVGASFASVASFIAELTGNTALAAALAIVSAWIGKVQTGLTDLTNLITQYQSAPSTSLLAEIEAGLSDVQQNLASDFSNLGLPAGILNVISGVAGLAGNLLAEWSAAIAGVKQAKTTAEFHAATAKFTTMADSLPQAMEQYKTAVNAVLSQTTGDATIDAALAKAQKL